MKNSIKKVVILSLLPLQTKAMFSNEGPMTEAEAFTEIFTIFGQNAAIQKKQELEKEKTESQQLQLEVFRQLQALKNDLSQPVQQMPGEFNLTEEYQRLLAHYNEMPPVNQFEIAWKRISQQSHTSLFNNLEKIAVTSHKIKSEDFKAVLQRILVHSAHAYALALSFPLLEQKVEAEKAIVQERQRTKKLEAELEALRKQMREQASQNK